MWYTYAIYFNGEKRFEALDLDSMSIRQAYERITFVFNEIEFCHAEGRMMDMEIFDALEDLDSAISNGELADVSHFAHVATLICQRFNLNNSSSEWVREEQDALTIWIDQQRNIDESNRRLFGK